MSLFLLLIATALSSVQVRGGSGAATRLQAALDACPSVGCDIQLPDALYPMEHQLWIVGKEDVRLRSTGSSPAVLRWEDSLMVPDTSGTALLFQMTPPPGGDRPDLPRGWLRWPLAAKGGVGTLADSTNPWATNGSQHNGMILVKSSRSVRLEGLVLDGNLPAVFANRFVWGGRYDHVHGSVGVAAFQSRGLEVLDCEIRNFWSAVYWNDRNAACAGWGSQAPGSFWTDCGTMGGHLVEASRLHGNKFGIYSEGAWDLGSVIRDNLAWDNYDRAVRGTGATVTSTAARASNDNVSIGGGFLFVKDVVFPAHVVTRNTVVDTGEARSYGWGYHRAAANALWSDNLLEMRAGYVYSTPLASSHHIFQAAISPHLWNTAVLTDMTGSIHYSMVRVVDSTIQWTALVPVARDTLDGELPGGKFVGLPGDTVDTVIAGTPTRIPRTRWVTIFYDTLPRDTSCAAGCWLPPETPLIALQSYSQLFWNVRMTSGHTQVVRLVAPDNKIVERPVWLQNSIDSTSPFRLWRDDTALARQRNLVASSNARFRSTDPSHPGFLSLDTTLPGTRRLLGFGSPRTHFGAIGADGSLRQEPIRLRARGHGRWDKASGDLVLPVAISGRLHGVDRLVVRRAWIAARPIVLNRVDGNTPEMTERRVLPLSLPTISPTDTVVRIPFADAGADSLYQVDLWLAGLAGSDTVEATPMAWSIATAMESSQTVGAKRGSMARGAWSVRGGVLRMAGPLPATLEFRDARGAHRALPVVDLGPHGEVDLSPLPRGVWFPRLPGARAVVSAGAARRP